MLLEFVELMCSEVVPMCNKFATPYAFKSSHDVGKANGINGSIANAGRSTTNIAVLAHVVMSRSVALR